MVTAGFAGTADFVLELNNGDGNGSENWSQSIFTWVLYSAICDKSKWIYLKQIKDTKAKKNYLVLSL